MEDFIAEIYQYSQIIPSIQEVIQLAYSQNGDDIKHIWDDLQPIIIDFCQEIAQSDLSLSISLYDSLVYACQSIQSGHGNLISFADKLNSDVLPLLYKSMTLFGQIDVTDGDFRLFSSKSGYISIENTKRNTLYCSSVDPMREAHEYAKAFFNAQCNCYHILGSGLGYIPLQLYYLSDCSAKIVIFHTNKKMIEYAFSYGVLSLIPESNLEIIVDEDSFSLLDKLSTLDSQNGTTDCIVLDEGLDCLSTIESEIMSDYQKELNTKARFRRSFDINVYKNIKNAPKSIYEYIAPKPTEHICVIAGGPSVDCNIEYIKKRSEDSILICASTILTKLLNNNITPDAVVVLDPQSRTYGHFNNLSNLSIPLFIGSSANWRFGEFYTGPKYLVPNMTDYKRLKTISSYPISPISLGSTVSSMAVQIALLLGAKRIDMIGLDLAYPQGKTHAEGTMDFQSVNTSDMPVVMSVNGEHVPTSLLFLHYIKEIEQLIVSHPNVKFINYSENGAKIKGSIWHRDWSD